MARRRVDRLRHPGGRSITMTVVRGAQMRSALHDASRNPDLRRARIETLVLSAPTRVFHGAAGVLDLAVVRVPVGGPLPDVSRHVVKPVPVGRERTDRRGPLVAILQQVLPGKLALPGV